MLKGLDVLAESSESEDQLPELAVRTIDSVSAGEMLRLGGLVKVLNPHVHP